MKLINYKKDKLYIKNVQQIFFHAFNTIMKLLLILMDYLHISAVVIHLFHLGLNKLLQGTNSDQRFVNFSNIHCIRTKFIDFLKTLSKKLPYSLIKTIQTLGHQKLTLIYLIKAFLCKYPTSPFLTIHEIPPPAITNSIWKSIEC